MQFSSARIRQVLGGYKRSGIAAKRNATVDLWTRHLHGDKRINAAPDDCIVVCMLKDADYYCEEFIEYHKSIGVSHFVFIDNGSSDRTVPLLKSYENVSIFSNKLPVRAYECTLRARIARRVVRGGWFLFLDSDELFGYPYGEGGHIGRLIEYCNALNYTAVVCQVLDLYGPEPYSSSRKMTYKDSIDKFQIYSIDEIDVHEYHDNAVGFSYFLNDNICDFDRIKILFGGMRREVFGEDCCLSTHRLVKNAPEINLYSHPHCSGNVNCADFTALLRHYKFCGPYQERDRRNVSDKVWEHGEDRKRIDRVGAAGDFRVECSSPRVYEDTNKLVEEGFLVASAHYKAKMNMKASAL